MSEDSVILLQLYTEALLVNLPTPDFSMPYNVICLACTVSIFILHDKLYRIFTNQFTTVTYRCLHLNSCIVLVTEFKNAIKACKSFSMFTFKSKLVENSHYFDFIVSLGRSACFWASSQYNNQIINNNTGCRRDKRSRKQSEKPSGSKNEKYC